MAPELKGDRLLIHTNSNRFWIQIKDWDHGDNYIKFFTSELDILQKISDDDGLESAVIYTDGQERGGMRRIKFGQLDLSGKTPTIIKHKFDLMDKNKSFSSDIFKTLEEK